MDKNRLNHELAALKKRYHIEWNTALHGAELRNFRYPEGWHLSNRRIWTRRDGVPRGPNHVAPLLLRIPNTYPRNQPWAYLPRDLRYTRGKVDHLINPHQVEWIDDFPSDNWLLWCVHDMGWEPNNPEYTLPRFLQNLQASFSYPDKDRPLRYALNNE